MPTTDLEVVKIAQLEKIRYLGNVLTGDGKYDTAIRTRIEKAKDVSQMLSEILKNKKIHKETKKTELLYGSEC